MPKQSFGLPQSNRSGKVFRNSRYGGGRTKGAPRVNIDRFINEAQTLEMAPEFVPIHRFDEFGLDERLMKNVASHGYVTPTPIQDGAIPEVMASRDVIGLANTGTGKTAAFLLPIIHNFLTVGRDRPALVVVPTRELASQIDDEWREFTRGLNLYSVVLVGGANMKMQIERLRRGPQIIIATPGRLKDLVNQGQAKLGRIGTFVLDEADRMVDMGFIRDIRYIIEQLPAQRQSLCFSATITPEVEDIIKSLLSNPVMISVRTRQTAEHVDQNVIAADSRDEKLAHLDKLLRQPEFGKVLIFGDTKYGVQRLSDQLEKRGFKATAIHGNKSQSQRQRALDAFKKEQVQVLVATDVAARGLDIPQVSHVINYDVPKTHEDYIHRIGRTGRAGHAGSAITFVPSSSVR